MLILYFPSWGIDVLMGGCISEKCLQSCLPHTPTCIDMFWHYFSQLSPTYHEDVSRVAKMTSACKITTISRTKQTNKQKGEITTFRDNSKKCKVILTEIKRSSCLQFKISPFRQVVMAQFCVRIRVLMTHLPSKFKIKTACACALRSLVRHFELVLQRQPVQFM